MSEDTNSTPNDADRVAEYFQIKDQLRTLRADHKDLQVQHVDYKELQELSKKVKILRENVKDDEDIKSLKAKIDQLKERTDLLKELIRIDLIESAQEEIKREGRKLKLVSVLKEMKDSEN